MSIVLNGPLWNLIADLRLRPLYPLKQTFVLGRSIWLGKADIIRHFGRRLPIAGADIISVIQVVSLLPINRLYSLNKTKKLLSFIDG